jgi:hypothetical protein
MYPEQGPIRISDVQGLLLWMLGDGNNPRWCFLKASPRHTNWNAAPSCFLLATCR